MRLGRISGPALFGEKSAVKEQWLVLKDSDRQGHGQPSGCPWPSAW